MSVLLTGGTGFVGNYLLNEISNCVVTSRDAQRAKSKLGDRIQDAIGWNPTVEDLDLTGYQFDACVNLMGESIAEGRWTDLKKQRIRDSRVVGTRRLVDAIIGLQKKPEVFVSASAVGFYGDRGDEVLSEQAESGEGFLVDVCKEWEAEAMRLEQHGVRVVLIRIGIVLGVDGGALEKLVPIFKWGIGGRLGKGQQWMPWIHVKDLARMIAWSIENPKVSGPINGTAPSPVRNAEFTKELAKHLSRPAFLPVPKFAVQAALGEFANSLFASQRVVPDMATQSGFRFKFDTLNGALQEIL